MSSTGFGDLKASSSFEQSKKIEIKPASDSKEVISDPEIKGSKTLKTTFKQDKYDTQNIKNGYIKLYDNAWVDLSDIKEINTPGSIKGIYKPQFNRTLFDKIRENFGLDTNPGWADFINDMMAGDAKDDDIPP